MPAACLLRADTVSAKAMIGSKSPLPPTLERLYVHMNYLEKLPGSLDGPLAKLVLLRQKQFIFIMLK